MRLSDGYGGQQLLDAGRRCEVLAYAEAGEVVEWVRRYLGVHFVPSLLFDASKHNLVKGIGMGQKFIMVKLKNEGNFMSIFSGYHTKHA